MADMSKGDYVHGTMDVTDQKKTYSGVMKFGGHIGLPVSLAIAAFFTFLLTGMNIFAALIAGLVIAIAANWIARTFFH